MDEMTWDATTATRRLAGLPAPEPLHPDLAACIVRRPDRLASLEHPLIVQSPYIPPLASYVNGLYTSLLQRADALLASGVHDQWLDLHARQFRLKVLVDHANRIDHGIYWDLLAALFRRELPVTDDAEARWARALDCDKPMRSRFMTRSESLAFEQLPGTIDAWHVVPADPGLTVLGAFLERAAADRFLAMMAARLSRPATEFACRASSLARQQVLALTTSRGMPELLLCASSRAHAATPHLTVSQVG